MQIVTYGTKNQVVIPKEVRKKIKHLKHGQKIGIYASDDKTIVLKVQGKKSWTEEARGIMKEAWKNIDPIAELEKMRNEW